MKRFISMLLSIVMCISVFSAAAVPVSAAYNENDKFYISNTEFNGTEITYTVGIKGGVNKLTGAIVHVIYNADHLEVTECVKNDSGFSGIFVDGKVLNNADAYSVGFMTASNVSVASDKTFFTITFKVIAEDKPLTEVSFKCIEFKTEDGNDSNDIAKSDEPVDLGSHSFHTLGSPTEVKVDSVGDGLKVSWATVDGATGYDVYRKAETESEFTKVNADPVIANEFQDDTIEKGIVYSYAVIAKNSYGDTTIDDTGAKGLNFGEISGFDAVATEKGIKVTWTALNGAEKYEISRKLADESNWQVIKTVDASILEFEDTNASSGKNYNYSVRAIKKDVDSGNEYSAGVSASVPVPVVKFIAKPTINAANTPDGIAVNVIAVGGATTYILSKKAENGEYAVIDEIGADSFADGAYVYLDTDVETDGKYEYSVQATDGEIYSEVAELTGSITKLAIPEFDDITNASFGVAFRWNDVSGAASYDIYRKAENGDYTFISNTKDTGYVDNSAANGIKYTYTVAAKDANGGVGAYNQTGWSITRLLAPEGLSTLAVENGVQFSWGAVAGAEKYIIYRTTTDEFKEFAETTDTTYTDTTAEKDVSYKYTVKAVADNSSSGYNGNGVEGKNFGVISEFSFTLKDNGVELAWSELPGAEGFKIYRKTASETDYRLLTTVNGVYTYEDINIPSGVECTYKVEPFSGNCLGIMTATPVTAKYLAIPVVDAANAGDGMVKITISPVYGAEKYIIERADGEGSTEFVQIGETDTEEYIDENNLIAGSFYQYRVKAVAGDLQSAYGSDSLYKMISPEVTKLTNEIAGIKVTWTKVADATSYNVYRKAANDKDWKKIRGGITSTSWTDGSNVSGIEYQYTVEANTPDGPTGYNLTGKSLMFLETLDPTEQMSVKNTTNSATLTWSSVKGATHYKIYRRGSGEGYKCIATISAAKTTYVDKQSSKSNSLKSGNSYKYTVRAQYTDSNGVSTLSNYYSDGIYLKYLSTPDVKSVANSTSGITVKWSRISGASGYHVYRKSYSNGKWSGWKKIATVKNTASSYTDKSVSKNSGKYYRYTITAYASKGTSAYENGLYTKRLMTPTPVSATSSRTGITFKWKSVSSASGYYVYRKTGNGGWKQIATVKGGTKVTYVDKTARKGTTYRYTVRAYNGKYISAYNSTGKTCKDRY